MSRPEFESIEHWLETAELPESLSPHPAITKAAVCEIARETDIDDLRDIDVLWQHLTHVAHDYERSKHVDFNAFPKASREYIGELRGKIDGLQCLLDEKANAEVLGWLDTEASIRAFQSLEVSRDESAQPGADQIDDVPSPIQFRAQLSAMDAFLEACGEQIGEPKRGRRENFALKVFTRQMLEYWTHTLGRLVTVDHQAKSAYSDAPHFLHSCLRRLDDVDETSINSVVRAYRAGKK